jgi:predicted HAD superfamily hydrolase
VQGLIANRRAHWRLGRATAPDATHFWRDFGYATAGPLVVGFTEWLIEQAEAHELDALYFLARDGLIMRRVYQELAPLSGKVKESHYLFASRRMLNFAAIEELDERALNDLTEGPGVTLAQYFGRLGLDMDAHADSIRAIGFAKPSHEAAGLFDRKRLLRLSLRLSDIIRRKARAEREIVRDYLVHCGMRDGRRIAVVDIGWRGTMQRSITDILNMAEIRPNIIGLYLGTIATATADPHYPHAGYLFHMGLPEENSGVLMKGVEVAELLFSAVEGSIMRIDRGPDDAFVAIRQSDVVSDEDRNRAIQLLQEGAMQFVQDYVALRHHFPNLRVPREVAMAQLKRTILTPTRVEARLIGDLPHSVALGDLPKRPIAPAYSLLTLLKRPDTTRRAWRRDLWKIGRDRRASPLQRVIFRLLSRI